jgi:hypothetical protein
MADMIINVDTDKIVKEKHIGWIVNNVFRTLNSPNEYSLQEIVERSYIHPQSKGMATISRIEVIEVRRMRKDAFDASYLVQLEAALNTVSQIEKLRSSEKIDASKFASK